MEGGGSRLAQVPLRAHSRRAPGRDGGEASRSQPLRAAVATWRVAPRVRRWWRPEPGCLRCGPLREGTRGVHASGSVAFGGLLLPRARRFRQLSDAAVSVFGSFLSLRFWDLLWQALPVCSDGTTTSAELDFPVINLIMNHSYVFNC